MTKVILGTTFGEGVVDRMKDVQNWLVKGQRVRVLRSFPEESRYITGERLPIEGDELTILEVQEHPYALGWYGVVFAEPGFNRDHIWAVVQPGDGEPIVEPVE
jgi:hypothetical protein